MSKIGLQNADFAAIIGTMKNRDEQDDFALSRRQMLKNDLAARGISDARILQAMGQIPRELFVSESCKSQAYTDGPLPIDWWSGLVPMKRLRRSSPASPSA